MLFPKNDLHPVFRLFVPENPALVVFGFNHKNAVFRQNKVVNLRSRAFGIAKKNIVHRDVFRAEKIKHSIYFRFAERAFYFGGIEFEEEEKNGNYKSKDKKHLFRHFFKVACSVNCFCFSVYCSFADQNCLSAFLCIEF